MLELFSAKSACLKVISTAMATTTILSRKRVESVASGTVRIAGVLVLLVRIHLPLMPLFQVVLSAGMIVMTIIVIVRSSTFGLGAITAVKEIMIVMYQDFRLVRWAPTRVRLLMAIVCCLLLLQTLWPEARPSLAGWCGLGCTRPV